MSLYRIIINKDLDKLTAALADGADANEDPVGVGITALHTASEHGWGEGVAALIAAGANTEAKSDREDTPLITAVVHKRPDAVKALLAGGANPEEPNKIGYTPLNYVVRMNAGSEVKMTSWVIEDGVKREVPVVNDNRARALATLEILLASTADAEAEDGQGMCAMHYAASSGDVDFARTLLDGGAKVDHANGNAFQPIHSASGKGDVDMVKLLLERGANASAADSSGFTPLHDAASSGNKELVDALLGAGADKGAGVTDGWKDIKAGMTPAQVAEVKGHADLAAHLA